MGQFFNETYIASRLNSHVLTLMLLRQIGNCKEFGMHQEENAYQMGIS